VRKASFYDLCEVSAQTVPCSMVAAWRGRRKLKPVFHPVPFAIGVAEAIGVIAARTSPCPGVLQSGVNVELPAMSFAGVTGTSEPVEH
jgi:hypothetical protein